MSTLKADTVQNTSGGPVTLTDQSAAKAWVRFAGSSTIQDSYNIASITDLETGRFQQNFSSSMSNANYAPTSNGGSSGNTGGSVYPYNVTTSSFRLESLNTYNSSLIDHSHIACTVDGDLA